MLIAAGVFICIFATVFGAYWAFVEGPEGSQERRLRRRLTPRRATELSAEIVKATERFSALEPLDAALNRWRTLTDYVNRLVHESGIRVTVGAVVLLSIFIASIFGVVVARLTSLPPVALAAALVGSTIPFVLLRQAAARRVAKLDEQFPEAMDLMARSLRAGHALTTALQNVGDEIADPVGAEFRLLFEQQNYGMSLPEALKALAARLPILDARFFVTAVLTQRETGGNLSEVLDNLAAVIRERFKVKREVRVISAHGRITGWVLSLLPAAVAVALLIVSPEHIRLLFEDPLGIDLVVGAAVLQLIGMLAIRRIVNVEY
jgi:tight adherence protein B